MFLLYLGVFLQLRIINIVVTKTLYRFKNEIIWN